MQSVSPQSTNSLFTLPDKDISSSEEIKSGGCFYNLVVRISRVPSQTVSLANRLVIHPLYSFIQKVIQLVKNLFSSDLNSSSSTKNDLLEEQTIDSTLAKQTETQSIQLENNALQVKEKIISIPGNGDCFFTAFYVGLRLLYPENKKLLDFLEQQKSQSTISSLFTSESKETISAPATTENILFLRQQVAAMMNKNLQLIQENPELIQYLIEGSSSPLEEEKELAVVIAKALVESVNDHNQSMQSQLTETVQLLETNHDRVDRLEKEINATTNGNSSNISLIKELSIYQESCDRLKKAIEEASNNPFAFCQVNFCEKDIPQLTNYVNNFISQSFNFASNAEIIALVNLFEVPVEIRAFYGEQPTDYYPMIMTPIKAQAKPVKPLVVQLKNSHYDLIVKSSLAI